MPELSIEIGGRTFQVACQEGEEHFLKSAAGLLNNEASTLVEQIGRMPEARMLLMAGLMLADRTAAFEDRAKSAEAKVKEQAGQIAALSGATAEPVQVRVEVPVIPDAVTEGMSEIAARAEALATLAEEKTAT
ncbi:cell division protein ZapA [Actibacterium sp. 188UL27-1]|uniref:cell division protein ZapA n=1 Tax=Actibacterium sp. 188UL27-1 TaxID=2786961 RepID=UPI00195A5714|nr:cell division protein ZapA [Actibacterium sp. 188UL27-1]MBM7067677.1 cell division protein ZapA [Actibacterium sp. 188UL27-1]